MKFERKKQNEHAMEAHDVGGDMVGEPGIDYDKADRAKVGCENKDIKSRFRCIRKHFLCCKTWLRILFIVLFVILYYVAKVVAAAVIVLQTLFLLFTGDKNQPITEFAVDLTRYIYQIAQYVCYVRDDKPFPFQAWPKADHAVVDEVEEDEHVLQNEKPSHSISSSNKPE